MRVGGKDNKSEKGEQCERKRGGEREDRERKKEREREKDLLNRRFSVQLF